MRVVRQWEQDRFQQLRAEKKHFLDTIKLIAYRAETALVELARDKMHRLDDARSVIRQLFRTEVDLIPDQQNKTLTVRLHPLTTEVHDQVLRYICQELPRSVLIRTQIHAATYPGTIEP